MRTSVKSIFDREIFLPAIGEAFKRLNPRTQVKNPVMFVTEVGALVTTIALFSHGTESASFIIQIALWLWFTVIFANFSEAVAEGRGKAQAASLRKTRARTSANLLKADGSIEVVPSESLRKGNVVIVRTGEIIPADGEVISGVAMVNESANHRRVCTGCT